MGIRARELLKRTESPKSDQSQCKESQNRTLTIDLAIAVHNIHKLVVLQDDGASLKTIWSTDCSYEQAGL